MSIPTINIHNYFLHIITPQIVTKKGQKIKKIFGLTMAYKKCPEVEGVLFY